MLCKALGSQLQISYVDFTNGMHVISHPFFSRKGDIKKKTEYKKNV